MKVGFFEEAEGVKSSIRLQMFLTMFFSFFVIGYQVVNQQVDLVLTIMLLSAAFAPKVISKIAEMKLK